MPESDLVRGEHGLEPRGDGWYILNVDDATWGTNEKFGRYCKLEGEVPFGHFGLNIHVLEPDQPGCHYHRESNQEGFLVLFGRCVVIIEGEEREMGPWDYLHTPPEVDHVFVGAGDGPCAILMVGARDPNERLVYPVDPKALARGAGVEVETPDPKVSYAHTPKSTSCSSPWRSLLSLFRRDLA